MYLNRFIISLFVAACLPAFASTPVYLDDSRPMEQRVEDALSRMTLEEKVAIIHAQSKFSSPGVPRLGIPELWTSDGPMGVRPEVLWDEWDQARWTNDSCTAFPSLTCLAATWNPEMARLYGTSLGEEACFRGKDVMLGPGVNIYRTPLCGRNFEYFGEDPCLASGMVVPYVQGMQDQGVAVCVKHFALNNNEVNRHTSNPIVDDRTLYEIYLPAFRAAAVDGGAWSFMGGYNLFRGRHASYNPILMNQILKGEWGFDGVVISDWGAVHDTPQAVDGGLDMEFGTWTDGLGAGASNAYDNYWLANPYLNGLREGKYDMATLDDKVRRVLRLTFRTAMNRQRPHGAMVSDEHKAACRRIGAEGIVLLQNRLGLLPLDLTKHPRIAVIGENAQKMMTVGGGSSSLKAKYEITPLQAIMERVAPLAEVVVARGYVGDPTGEYNGVTTGQDLSDPRSPEELLEEAVRVASEADIVLYFGGLNKSNHQDCEDTDRLSYSLPYDQDRLIQAITKANPNTVVVNISGTGVAMPWAGDVAAVLQAWYLGSETGNAIVDVLTGEANPSGKMPYTLYATLDQCGAHALDAYPGTLTKDEFGNDMWDMPYSEGVFVGYRYTDKHGLKPTFPFGHGLSYTTFAVDAPSKLQQNADGTYTLTATVTNTGSRPGQETLQLYVGPAKPTAADPVKQLKAFRKVMLEPGESADVTFTISAADAAHFDADAHAWTTTPGRYKAYLGTSSADIHKRFDLRF